MSPIDDVINNVNKVSNEINVNKMADEDKDVTLTNGEDKANDDEAAYTANGVDEDTIDTNADTNALADVNDEVAEILDFIDNINDKVQKALEGDENVTVTESLNVALDGNVALTNGFDSIAQEDYVQENSKTVVVDKNVVDDKIDSDDIEIIDDINPSDIVEITSDDEDRLLESPLATLVAEDAKVSIKDSNDFSEKSVVRKSPHIEESAEEKKRSSSSDISSIVIDVDGDDDDDESNEEKNDIPRSSGDAEGPQEIKTIDLDDDEDDEEIEKTDEKNVETTVSVDVCAAHDENVTEVNQVSKPVEAEDSKKISLSPDGDDSITVDSKECTDSIDALVAALPAAENATEKEKEIIAAIDQDIDQGNNLLEEMDDVPISNGASSEGSTSANEDEDIDSNHFASDDIILLPYEDDVSKSSLCSEITKEASLTTAPIDRDTGKDGDGKVESSVCEMEETVDKAASTDVNDSAESAVIKPLEKIAENLEQNNAISSTETAAEEKESSTESTINIAETTTLVGDEATPDEDSSLPIKITKNKMDPIDIDEIQPDTKKPRMDSLFDLLKETSSVEPSANEAKIVEPMTVSVSIVTSESESSTSKIDDETQAANPDVSIDVEDEDIVLIETSTEPSEVISTGFKRSAESDLSIEFEPTKKLKMSDEVETDAEVKSKTAIEETSLATTEIADTTEIVSAEIPKITLSPEPTKPEQKQTLALDFLKKFKRQFDQMSKKDLEDLVMGKIVEAIVHKSEYSELRSKAEAQEQMINSFRVKLQELGKQYRDLEMVHSRVVKDLEARNQNVVNPIKITRAVGLQVCLMKKDATSSSTIQSASTSPAQSRPTVVSAANQQVTKVELARRAAMVLHQQKLQKMQRQTELNKQKQEIQEELAKKNKMTQQKATEANKQNVRLLHNQQLRMKAQMRQNQQSQQNKVVHLLPKATTVTVAQTPPLRKSLPVNTSQLT